MCNVFILISVSGGSETEKPKKSLPLFGAMKGGRKFKLKTGTIGVCIDYLVQSSFITLQKSHIFSSICSYSCPFLFIFFRSCPQSGPICLQSSSI